jgi:flavin reductase (DIM6/NTAB) family NADH-FMN oxidoreductase RutF
MKHAPADLRTVKPPHVAEAAISMECELVHKYEVRKDDGGLSNTVVFGRVKRFHMVRLLPYAPSLQYSPAQLP